MDKIEKKNKKIRKGDKVVAIAGNYRGQFGTVLSCEGNRAVVQGLNMRKHFVKASEQNKSGGIIELEGSMHVSNLKVCAADGRPVKLKVRENTDGERQLVYKNGDDEAVYRSMKKS